MNKVRTVLAVALASLATVAVNAQAWQRGSAETFATLPTGTAHPEGIAADAEGNIYVANFDVEKSAGNGDVVIFHSNGKLLRHLTVEGSSPLLLGVSFLPQTQELLVIDFGNKKILRVNPQTGRSIEFATIPGGTAAGPNALAFDANGNVYVSDSFQGTIWRIPAEGGTPVAWINSDLLRTTGVPPFGANGMAFNSQANALFVANTGNDTVVKIPLPNGPVGNPGVPEVFVNSINGADGLIIDDQDNLWVAANQADEIVVVAPDGKVVAKLGDFSGVASNGSPVGLLFPASLVRVGDSIYVTNLALDLRKFGLPQTVDSQWTAAISQHTIARIRAKIPPLRGM